MIMKEKKQITLKLKMVLLLFACLVSTNLLAQSAAAGLNEASSMLASYFDPLVKVVYTGSALCGMVGAWGVFSKFIRGEPDGTKHLGAYGGGCIFLLIIGKVLSALFL